MARLPDAMDLGERRVGDGRTRIVVDQSAQIAAEGLDRTAQNINAAVQRYAQHDDAFNYARAKSALLTADAKIRKDFETDGDWATQETRYNEAMKTAREEAGKLIKGARSRALFDNDAKLDVDRGAENIRAQARSTEGHWGRGELDKTLDQNRTAALETKDVKTRDALIQATQDSIHSAVQKRYITPDQAVELQQHWAKSYGEGFIDVQTSDAEKLKLLRNPKGNPSGFIDPDKRQEMIQRLEEKMKADSNEARSHARQLLAERVQDAQASWLNGADYRNPPTKAEFLAAYPADQAHEAERAYNAFAAVKQVAVDLQALPRMSPTQRAEFVSAKKPQGGEGAKAEFDAHRILAARAVELNQQLADDPAEYVATYSPTVQAAGVALQANPSPQTAQAFAAESLSAQRAMGVSSPRVLSEGQAHEMGERLTPSGNGESAVEAINQEKNTWGRYWPQVLAEAGPKLPPAVQAISLGMDPVPAAKLATIASMKPEELSKLIPEGTSETRIRKDAASKLHGLTASFLGWSGGEQGAALFIDQTTKLASSYMAGGLTQSKAIERAANEVVLSRYDLTRWAGNDLRIPKGKFNVDLVVAGLRTLAQRTLKDNGIDSGDVRWWTTPDDSSVVLKDATTGRTLTKPDGSPLAKFTYQQLQQAAVNIGNASNASADDYQGY